MQNGQVVGFNEYYNYTMVPQRSASATVRGKGAKRRKLTKKEIRAKKIKRIKAKLHRKAFIPAVILITCFLLAVAKRTAENTFSNNNHGLSDIVHAYSMTDDNTSESIGNIFGGGDDDWETILVNKTHKIPDNYDVELTTLSNGVQVDSRIYPELQRMFDDMRSEGIYPVVGEGYRSHEQQEQMMEDKIDAYIAEGYSKMVAKHQAKKYVAKAGYSEHELGIALDINASAESETTHDEVYQWLCDNAYKYGFILRYPEGKEDITGIDYEPWHYRYVGKEAALEIYENGLTLEEYLENK